MDLGVDHGQVDLADAEQRVAEGENIRPVDVGDGAGGDRAHVAAHQLDADRRAGLDVTGRRRSPVTPAARLQRDETGRAKGLGQLAHGAGREAGDGERHRGAQQARLAVRGSGADRRQAEAARQRVGRPESAVVLRERAVAAHRRNAKRLLAARLTAWLAFPLTVVGSAFGEVFAPHATRAPPLGQHRLDRRDAAEWLLGKAPGVGDRTDQLAVDVDRASAHAGDDAAELDARILGADEDDVLLGQEVVHHGDHPHLERLGFGPLEDRQRLSDHPRLDLGERHDGRRRSGGHHGPQPHPFPAGRRCGNRKREREQPKKQAQPGAMHETQRVEGRSGPVNAMAVFSGKTGPRMSHNGPQNPRVGGNLVPS